MKKTRHFQEPPLARRVLKTMLLMKFSMVIVLAASLQVSANTYSQDKISVDFRNVKLVKALKEVEQKSDYRFVYSSLKFPLDMRITFQAFEIPVREVLDSLLVNTGLHYRLMENKLAVIIRDEKNIPPIIIKGKVTNDKNEPLAGVTVQVKGTNTFTVTGAGGVFSIDADENARALVFSYVGMETKEVNIVTGSNMVVQLSPLRNVLSDVVVIGYGSQNRKDLTGSITSLASDKFDERPVANIEQAIAGQAAGVEISPRNASPGQISAIKIRGVGSITAGFGPLWVIDGFPTDQLQANAINPADIQSVDILKDASATAIYGSRGANGVILITTKSGKEGKVVFNYDVSTGISKVNKNDFFDMLNAEEYVQYMTEAAENNGQTVRLPITNWDNRTNTNWQNEIYRAAPYQNHTLSASGGTAKTTYNFSLGYIDQGGIVKGTDFTKFSARARVDFRPSEKFRIGLNIAPNYNFSNNMPDGDFTSPLGAAVFMPPIIPIRMPDGSYGDTQKFPGISDIQIANPLQIIDLYKDKTKSMLFLMNTDLEWEIVNGLKFRTSFGVNTSNVVNETYSPSTLSPLPRNPTATYRSDSYLNWLNENTLTYSKSFNNVHSLNVLGGFTSQKQDNTLVTMSANSFPTNNVPTLNGGTVLPTASGTFKSAWALVSYLGRVNYNYLGKYFLTATIRSDGSSRFGANNRFGVFPSAAVAWKISDESFLKGASFIDLAKIRGSYGRTGNNFISDFASIGLLNTVNQPFGTGSGSNNIGLTNSTASNPDLTWEIADQMDIGIDLSLFRNRFNITFDYYSRLTKSLLLNVNVPVTTGYAGVLKNIGKMRTNGIELSLNYQVLDGNFKWNLGGNLATMQQEVLALGPDGSPIIGFFGTLVTKVGGKLEEGRGLHAIGILSAADIANGVPLFGASKAGDYKFEDVNNDGKIDGFNQADGVLLGNNNNKIIYGVTSSFQFKSFDLSFLIQGQGGARLYDLFYQLGGIGINGINSHSFYYDGRYVSESQPGDGKTPRAGYFAPGTPTNYYQQPTDFVRIRNITMGYNFAPGLFTRTPIKNLRAYISIDNLSTFTKFLGGNPNTSRQGDASRAAGDGRFLGLNSIPSVPLPRTYSFGVSIKF